jgi:hypothetical protein
VKAIGRLLPLALLSKSKGWIVAKMIGATMVLRTLCSVMTIVVAKAHEWCRNRRWWVMHGSWIARRLLGINIRRAGVRLRRRRRRRARSSIVLVRHMRRRRHSVRVGRREGRRIGLGSRP